MEQNKEREALYSELYSFFMGVDGGYVMDTEGDKITDKVMEIAARANHSGAAAEMVANQSAEPVASRCEHGMDICGLCGTPPAAPVAQGLTEDDVWLLASAAENLRSADKTERRVESAFRIAAKLDELRKRLAQSAPAATAPSDGARQAPTLTETIAHARKLSNCAAPAPFASPAPKLTVFYGAMPESNGKSNWTAILYAGAIEDGITLDRSEYPDRVRYEADRARWLIGELEAEPSILDYDVDKRSGYVAPAREGASPAALTGAIREHLQAGMAALKEFSPDNPWVANTRALLAASPAEKELDFEPDAQHTVADMANVGFSLMQAIRQNRPDYAWNETPAEIVVDLLNEIAEAAQPPAAAEAEKRDTWKCGALAHGDLGGHGPSDCNWPMCGCDPMAAKVIGALQESGVLAATETEKKQAARYRHLRRGATNRWGAQPSDDEFDAQIDAAMERASKEGNGNG